MLSNVFRIIYIFLPAVNYSIPVLTVSYLPQTLIYLNQVAKDTFFLSVSLKGKCLFCLYKQKNVSIIQTDLSSYKFPGLLTFKVIKLRWI